MSNNFVTLEGLEPSTPALRTCDRTQTCDPCWFISKTAHSINWTTQVNAIFRDNRELKSAVLYLLSYKVNISAESIGIEPNTVLPVRSNLAGCPYHHQGLLSIKIVLWITNNHRYFFTPSRFRFLPAESWGVDPHTFHCARCFQDSAQGRLS